MQTAGPDEVDVAIIGCGPVGAMLANLLGMCGVSVCVLDRAGGGLPVAPRHPFRRRSDARHAGGGPCGPVRAPAAGVPRHEVRGCAGPAADRLVAPAVIGPQGWFPSYRFHQPELEQAMRAGLDRFAHVVMVAPAV